MAPTVAASSADQELRDLKQRDAKGTAADRRNVMRDIARLEREYPNDYRFPYERAKLAAKGSKRTSRTEVFKALNVAAEKAITTGKANEMLTGLETDKTGDFSELAQGRNEWTRLVVALKRKDTSLLSE